MDILPIDRSNPNPAILTEAVRVLKAGGIVAHPTDTCYGLAADIRNPDAIKKVFAIKQIPLPRSISIIVNSLDEAERFAVIDEETRLLAEKFLPGALTLVVPQRPYRWALPSTNESIGIRIPNCAVSRALAKELGAPITTTSANITGQEPSFSGKEVMGYFEQAIEKPDLLLNAGELSSTVPSTVIRINDAVTLLREGAIPWEQIQRALNH